FARTSIARHLQTDYVHATTGEGRFRAGKANHVKMVAAFGQRLGVPFDAAVVHVGGICNHEKASHDNYLSTPRTFQSTLRAVRYECRQSLPRSTPQRFSQHQSADLVLAYKFDQLWRCDTPPALPVSL